MGPQRLVMSIKDSSPFLNYFPSANSADISSGWTPFYSISGYNPAPGTLGEGTSSHITSANGGSVEFLFTGDYIELRGNANCTYNVLIDGKKTPIPATSDDILFAMNFTVLQQHKIQLTALTTDNTQQLSFREAVISTPSNSSVLRSVQNFNNDTRLSYKGSWTLELDPRGQPFHQTQEGSASVSFQFSNAVAIAINGPTAWDHAVYVVNLDGTKKTYSASTVWTVPDALLFYQSGLDPARTYKVSLGNRSGGDKGKLALTSITIFQGDAPGSGSTTIPDVLPTTMATSTSATNPARGRMLSKITAGIIAGIIVTLFSTILILLLARWWWRYRRGRQAHDIAGDDVQPYIISKTIPENPTAFLSTASLAPLDKSINPSSETMGAILVKEGTGGIIPQVPSLAVESTSNSPILPRRSTRRLQRRQGVSPSVIDEEAAVERILQLVAARIDKPPSQRVNSMVQSPVNTVLPLYPEG